jgi:DNA polymerase theta
MSATLPNLNVVANWLDADLYRTDFRPVPLTELVKIGADIYDCTVSNRLRSIMQYTAGRNSSDDGDIVPLCLETVSVGCSVLIFCPTKNWCEKLADSVAREFYRLLNDNQGQGTGM